MNTLICSYINDLEIHCSKLIDYCWEDEFKNFQESFEISIGSNDDLHEWILWCQDCELAGNPKPINHIFYSLMILKDRKEQIHKFANDLRNKS